jgi:lipoate-protein ligase A
MAIDEAVLLARLAGGGPPTVRFFGWRPPTVSLGHGQPLDDAIDLDVAGRLGIGLVRRPTGGSAILHESPRAEVTYSVVARRGDFPGADDLLQTYRIVAAGLAAGLARLGAVVDVAGAGRDRRGGAPAFCFARTGSHEIAARGRKLVGSAQRRQGGAFLQHGSILLDADPTRLRAVFPRLGEPLATVTTLAEVLGRSVGFDETVAAVAAGLGEAFGVELAPGGLSEAETGDVERLVAAKYATDAWTFRGQIAVA